MKFKSDMSVRNKLLVGFMIVIFLLVGIGALGIFYTYEMYGNGKHLYETDLKSIQNMRLLSHNVKLVDDTLILYMNGEVSAEKCEALVHEKAIENEKLLKECLSLDISQEQRNQYLIIKQDLKEYEDKNIEMIALGNKATYEELSHCYEQINIVKSAVYVEVQKVIDFVDSHADEVNEQNEDSFHQIVWMICILMLTSLLIAVFISVNISNYIVSKLKSIRLMAKRISEYNISDDILNFGNDEFGETVKALNESQFMVRELLEKIIRESAIISDVGEEVSLAVRKSEQRIEKVNVEILEYDRLVEEIEREVRHIFQEFSLEDLEKLDSIKDNLNDAKKQLNVVRTELSSIAIYLEQIGITSDYQNEIANDHKEQIAKFKINDN